MKIRELFEFILGWVLLIFAMSYVAIHEYDKAACYFLVYLIFCSDNSAISIVKHKKEK